jgi:hypothetical protein
VDEDRNVYVAGQSPGSGTYDDFATIKYTQPTGIEGEDPCGDLPAVCAVGRATPNPFCTSTTISLALPAVGRESAELRIFDVSGRVVRVLAVRSPGPGSSSVVWNARDDGGRRVPSGIYLCQLRAGGRMSGVGRLVVVR